MCNSVFSSLTFSFNNIKFVRLKVLSSKHFMAIFVTRKKGSNKRLGSLGFFVLFFVCQCAEA